MEDIIVQVIVIFFAFYCGWKIRGVVMLANLSSNPERTIKLLEGIKKINDEEELQKPSGKVEVTPEQVGAVWYAYAKENGQFLGQGTTLEEALKMASLRFPNKVFWCDTSKSNLTKQA